MRAQCSKVYTNHCIRHTTANAMSKAGFSIQQIAFVTDHSNYQSLESDLAEPEKDDYEQFNDKMFDYHDDTTKNLKEIQQPESVKRTSCKKSTYCNNLKGS